jgi:dimethylamine--corrinoid protein Co-methyltransferase
MPSKIITSMGDGERLTLSVDALREDLVSGSQDAADRGKIPSLTDDEIDHLQAIFADPSRMVSVERGQEVVMTDDGTGTLLYGDSTDAGQNVPVSPTVSLMAYERAYTAI